jgi:hypothetical protein
MVNVKIITDYETPKTNLYLSFGYENGHFCPNQLTIKGTAPANKWCHDYPPIKNPWWLEVGFSNTKPQIECKSGGGNSSIDVVFYVKEDANSSFRMNLTREQAKSLRDVLSAILE